MQGSRRQHASGHNRCRNLPLCSILPINKIPAQAEPLASTEMLPSVFVHCPPQRATRTVAAGSLAFTPGLQEGQFTRVQAQPSPTTGGCCGDLCPRAVSCSSPCRTGQQQTARHVFQSCTLPRTPGKGAVRAPAGTRGWAADTHSHVSSCSNVTSPSCGGSSRGGGSCCSHPGQPRGRCRSFRRAATCAVTAPADGFFRTRAGFPLQFRD